MNSNRFGVEGISKGISRRRFIVDVAALGAGSVGAAGLRALSGFNQLPDQSKAIPCVPEDASTHIPLEKWTSQVRQSLNALFPTNNMHYRALQDMVPLASPFLNSNAVVAARGSDPDEIIVKCYVNVKVEGEDIGDDQLKNPKRRIVEITLVSNPKQPNRTALLIRTSVDPVLDADIERFFNPNAYPFDVQLQLMTTYGYMLDLGGKVSQYESNDPKTKDVLNQLWLDLQEGQIINPPPPIIKENLEQQA